MATDQKISQLTENPSITGTEELATERGGSNYKNTFNSLKTFFGISGTNTGDETTGTIQSKRPLKTVGGETLEGTGDVEIGFVLAEWYGAVGDGITDDSLAIQNALNVGSVLLKGKIYIVGSNVIIPKGVTLKGSGNNTVIQSTPSFTSGTLISMEEESSLSHLKMVGDASYDIDAVINSTLYPFNLTELDARKGQGLLNGVVTNSKRADVDYVYFTQFSGTALTMFENAVNQSSQPLRNIISSNTFDLNYTAIHELERSEYSNFSNNVFKYNMIGLIVDGGNNAHSNNHIDHNRFGVVLGGDPLINNAHGSFTGGSINHSKVYSFIARDVQYGERITGIDMFDSGTNGVYISDSKAINFAACTFSKTIFLCEGEYNEVNNTGQNLITGCMFRDVSVAGNYTVDVTGNTLMYNNEVFDGGESNTTWVTQILNNSKYDRDGWYYKNVNGQNTFVGKDVIDYNVNGGGNLAGDIRIKLPIGLSNQMLSMNVEVYGNTRTMNYTIKGWALAAGWAAAQVSIKSGDNILDVDYGKDDDGNLLIYLSDGGSWRYESVRVTDFTMFRGNFTTVSTIKNNWEIELTTETHKNITATVTPS